MLDHYASFKNNMILRDFLALDRTILANERTCLAYLRTFIGTFSAGVAMIELLHNTLLINIIGYAFIAVSPLFLLIGVTRYIDLRKKLRTLRKNEDQ